MMRYLLIVHAWQGIGVVVVFVVELKVVLCFSVALVYFVFDVHT